MTSKYFLGLVLAGGAVAAIGSGCSSSTDTSKGGTGGTSTTSSSSSSSSTSTSSSSTSTSSSSTSTSSSSGSMGTSCANAIPISVMDGMPQTGTLADPVNDKVFYTFTGKKGEAFGVATTAKPAPGMGDPFDKSYLDLVVTIMDKDGKNTIAQDDDPWPRNTNDPTLLTVLPADGDYCLVVDECNVEFGVNACAPAGGISNNDFTVNVFDIGGTAVTKEGAEPANDTSAGAAASPLVIAKSGANYTLGLVYGQLQSGTDKDYFEVTLPADSGPGKATSRPRLQFWVQPSGTLNGDGSTTSPGKIYLVDPADLTHHVAEIDDTVYDQGDDPTNGPANISVPLKLSTKYWLVVEHSAMPAGANDFYVAYEAPSAAFTGWNVLETADVTNDLVATPEVMHITPPSASSTSAFFDVDGDMTTAADVDWYSLDSTGMTKIYAVCAAQRSGSGVRGLTYQFFEADGVTPISGATATEDPQKDISLGGATGITITPAAATKILLKVTATSLDANVTDTSYECNVGLAPM